MGPVRARKNGHFARCSVFQRGLVFFERFQLGGGSVEGDVVAIVEQRAVARAGLGRSAAVEVGAALRGLARFSFGGLAVAGEKAVDAPGQLGVEAVGLGDFVGGGG